MEHIMFRNILVSVDGSPHAERALSEAIDIATESRGRVTLLTAVSTPPPWAYNPVSAGVLQSLASELAHESEEVLRAAVERVPNSIPVTSILSHKPVRKALMCELSSGRHDLLVMGSRGRKAVQASLFGSVSHFALNHSPIPVLVIHENDAPKSGARRLAEAGLPLQEPGPGGALSTA
jgi:nucleotide-binding universal stress UspA family protein